MSQTLEEWAGTKPATKEDVVNSPSHYNAGGIECIEALKAALTPDEFRGFLKGNAIKYLWRERHKGHSQDDQRKAEWYLRRLIEVETKEQG